MKNTRDRKTVMIALWLLLSGTTALAQVGETEPRDAGDRPARDVAPGARLANLTVAKMGEKAPLTDDSGVAIGQILDWVVDLRSSEITQLIVRPADAEDMHRAVAVPYESLVWNAKERTLCCKLGQQQLAGLPPYEGDAPLAPAAGKPAQREHFDGQEGKPDASPTHMRLGEMLDQHVLAGTTEVGTIHELVIEPERGMLALALVQVDPQARGSVTRPFVIPWQALRLAKQGSFSVSLAASELSKAPRVDGGDLRPLERRDALDAIARLYGVRLPWVLATKAEN